MADFRSETLAEFLRRWAGPAAFATTSAIGLGALLYPLWVPAPPSGAGLAPAALAGMVALCAGALAMEAVSGGLGARRVAALGALVAAASALRFIEVALPGPGGFSPVFLPIILAGFVFGPRFGFLMGSMTLAVSAVVTGGVGPWLPAQMLVAGWVGLSAGWLPGRGTENREPTRWQLGGLASFGAFWGMLYGLLLTPWMWLLYDGGLGGGLVSGGELRRFAAFYLTTSLVWDSARAVGNVALVLLAGPAVIRALRRLGRWFSFQSEPLAPLPSSAPTGKPQAALTSQAVRQVARQLPVGRRAVAAGRKRPRQSALLAPGRPGRVSAPRLRNLALPPLVWVAWALAVASVASASRNPAVLAVLLLAVAVVRSGTRAGLPTAVPLPLGRLGAWILAFSGLYGAAALHGGTTVLLRLPAAWPLVGGPWTAEGLVYGTCSGLALFTLLYAFAVLQEALGTRGIVDLLPRALSSLAMVAVIALTHLPSAGRRAVEAREAWTVRGATSNGLRAWRRLALPVFVGGLERSASLAESLALRGLDADIAIPAAFRLGIVGSLVLLATGWLLTVTGRAGWPAGAAVLVGIALGGLTAVRLSRWRPRTELRPVRWSPSAAAAGLMALGPLAALALPSGRPAAAWSPFPTLTAPPMDVITCVCLALAAAPVLAAWCSRGRERPKPVGPAAPRTRSAGPPPAAARRPPRQTPLTATSFGYRYPGAPVPVFTGLSFEMAPGTLHLVAGPSGSGKSTLLKAMTGLVPHFSGGSCAGRLLVAGMDPLVLGPAGMAGRVGLVPGDAGAAFIMDTVQDEVAFALEERALPVAEIRRRVAGALRDVGLWRARHRAVASLSGGERQRLAIAAAVALEPDVLLLDEPTSQLDDANAARVLDVVQNLTRTRGTTVVVTEHRLERVMPRAATVLWLRLPAARGGGEPDAALGPERLALGPREPASRRCYLEMRGVSAGFGSGFVLRNVQLSVHAGEVVAVTGPSGSGKTTLLRTAVGLLRPHAGYVRLDGQPLADMPAGDVFRHVGYVPQDPDVLLLERTVSEELDLTLAAHQLPPLDGSRPAFLAQLRLDGFEDAYPRDLSSGERLRVALGAVMVAGPRLLVLDEPTRGLDDEAAAALVSLLRRLARQGAAVLLATHDRRLAVHADRALCLTEGRLRAGGAPRGDATCAPCRRAGYRLRRPVPHGRAGVSTETPLLPTGGSPRGAGP